MDAVSRNIVLLTKIYQQEIEHICGIDDGSTTILQLNWIPGTELTIGVPPWIWNRVCSGIPDRVSFSDKIHVYWFQPTHAERWYHAPIITGGVFTGSTERRFTKHIGNDLYIRIGLGAWQSTRVDRLRGSRMTTMLNNDSIASTKRLQTVKLVKGGGTGALPYEAGDVQGQHRLLHLMAQFLEISLRLSPRDIGTLLGRIARQRFGPSDARRLDLVGSCEEENLMLQAALGAIIHAQRNGYWTGQLYKIRNPPRLKKLDDQHHISAADRSFDKGWGVLVILCSIKAREAICQRQPSFFICTPGPLRCKPQVHIIDTPVCGCPSPLLLGFSEKPCKEVIDEAMHSVYGALGIPHHTSTGTIGSPSAIVTEPFAKEDNVAWFRADGVLEMKAKDRVLSRYLRQAMAKLRSTHFEWKGIWDSGFFVDSRESVRWVLWLRQSNEDGPRARDTMPRQLTTLLLSTLLGKGFRDGDEVVICCELCSSSKHPLTDRRLWNAIRGMGGVPVHLLTVNPDRMTRRAEEVDTIKAYVASTGGFWYTQGVMKKDCKIEEWYKVDGAIVVLIKAQLALGRKRALQAGCHARQTQVMTIVNDAVDRMESVPIQVNAAAAVIRHCVEAHGYQRICTIAHTGVAFDAGKKSNINKSIVRQSLFLSIMVEACQVPVVPYEISGVSNGDLLKTLENLPDQAEIGGPWVKNAKTLFVVCSVSRLVSSRAEHEKMKKVAGIGGVMALLWDSDTEPDACKALHLDEIHRSDRFVAAWDKVLDGQKRVPKHNLNLPILQPILWISGPDQDNPNTKDADRHVKSAEDFRLASETSAYQGGAVIAPELSERPPDEHGLSDEREKA